MKFEIDGKIQKLMAYTSYPVNQSYANQVFLPFQDKTTGNKTYGGGRYLNLDKRNFEQNTITINFNKAYNPYCAFSTGYNCPVPPKENLLDVEILAGEKIPKSDIH